MVAKILLPTKEDHIAARRPTVMRKFIFSVNNYLIYVK
jgi:hypothetical protein